jgi:hypothetical protein
VGEAPGTEAGREATGRRSASRRPDPGRGGAAAWQAAVLRVLVRERSAARRSYRVHAHQPGAQGGSLEGFPADSHSLRNDCTFAVCNGRRRADSVHERISIDPQPPSVTQEAWDLPLRCSCLQSPERSFWPTTGVSGISSTAVRPMLTGIHGRQACGRLIPSDVQ